MVKTEGKGAGRAFGFILLTTFLSGLPVPAVPSSQHSVLNVLYVSSTSSSRSRRHANLPLLLFSRRGPFCRITRPQMASSDLDDSESLAKTWKVCFSSWPARSQAQLENICLVCLRGAASYICHFSLSLLLKASRRVTDTSRNVTSLQSLKLQTRRAPNQMCGCRSDSRLRRCEANAWMVAGPGAVDQFAVQSKARCGIIMLAVSRNIRRISVEQQLYPLWGGANSRWWPIWL